MNCLYCNHPLNVENHSLNIFSCATCPHQPWFVFNSQLAQSVSFYVDGNCGIFQNFQTKELTIFYPDPSDETDSVDIIIPFDRLCEPGEVMPLLDKVLKLKAFI